MTKLQHSLEKRTIALDLSNNLSLESRFVAVLAAMVKNAIEQSASLKTLSTKQNQKTSVFVIAQEGNDEQC
jgi:hypothetical protein